MSVTGFAGRAAVDGEDMFLAKGVDQVRLSARGRQRARFTKKPREFPAASNDKDPSRPYGSFSSSAAVN